MIFVEKMKNMKIYKQQCFLPTVEGNKKKDSAVILLTPNYESSRKLMNNPLFINKRRFESYFLDRDVSYYIGNKKLEEVDESFLYLEETKRSELKDSDFGIPEDRKFPLDTEEHVRSAIKLFGHAEESKKKSLARKISRRASKYGIKIPETTQVYKYLHEAIMESFQPAEEDDNLEFKFSVPQTDIIDIKWEMDEKEARWNTRVLVKGVVPKTLRGRSECVVIRDNMIYMDETESGICSKGGIAKIKYDVPGGGWDPNEPHDICAIRETNEEAKIDVKDVQYVDNYLTIDKKRPEGCYCDGLFSEVYVGKYNGRYTGPVADVDRADIAVSGDWYPIREVYGDLNPIHQKAIRQYFGDTFGDIVDLSDYESPIDEIAISESIQKSDLDSNFKKKSISDINYETIDFHDPKAKKYIDTDSYLSNLYNKNQLKDFNGEIIVDKDKGVVIGRVFIGTGKDEGYIGALRVYDAYKGYGFGDILIKDAIHKYKGYDLNVFKDNEIAIKMYKKYGFKIADEDSSDKSYYMKLESKINEATISLDKVAIPNRVTFSKSFSDVKDIVDTLSKDDLSHICNGTFKNSPYVKYREVLLIDKDPAAFVDVYSIPKEMNKNEGVVVCACKSKYRGNNYTEILAERMKKNIKKVGISKLYWETTKSNKASSTIAKKLGFSKSEDINKDDDNYSLLIETISDSDNIFSSIEAFNKELNSWDYGVLVNGKVYTDADKIDWSKYKTIPIKDIEKHHVGICWDFVNYEYDWFAKNGIKPDAYMFVMQKSDRPDDIVTHTFIIFKMNGKQYWFESSWFGHQGVKEVKSYTDVVDELVEKYGDHNYSVFKYNPSGLDKNINNGDFFKKTTKNLVKNYEAIKEGTEFILET